VAFEAERQPCRRGRADEFDFAFGGEAVEFFLWKSAVPVPFEDIRHAVRANFFARRRGFELIDETRNEHVRGGFMQGDETVFRADDFGQGVPLRTPTETIGVLVVQHYQNENAYDQRDLEFLESVGGISRSPSNAAAAKKRFAKANRCSASCFAHTASDLGL